MDFYAGARCMSAYYEFRGVDFLILNRRHFPTQRSKPISTPEDHQDNMQQPSPPQCRLSLCIAWLVKRYSEARIPETRTIRF